MAQTLDEQVAVIERSLGECMIDTALVIVRTWLTELGDNNPYEEAYTSLQARYKNLFSKWLNIADPADDEQLNHLTGETYQLARFLSRTAVLSTVNPTPIFLGL